MGGEFLACEGDDEERVKPLFSETSLLTSSLSLCLCEKSGSAVVFLKYPKQTSRFVFY